MRFASAGDFPSLARLLVEVVEAGASVRFVHPLALAEAERFWGAQTHPLLFLAVSDAGDLAGCVELKPAWQPNATHRAEVAKLLVSPKIRRGGVGRALMQRCEVPLACVRASGAVAA